MTEGAGEARSHTDGSEWGKFYISTLVILAFQRGPNV